MKTTLPLLAILLLATPSARALDPALLGVGFTSSADAKPSLDTTRRTKVADAWAYPITAQATLLPATAQNITRHAYVRPVSGGWAVVAAKLTFTLPDRAACDGLASTLAQTHPRTLTETIDGKTTSTFRAQDEHATLTAEQKQDGTHACTLLLWHQPTAGDQLLSTLAQSRQKVATPKAEHENKPQTPQSDSFLGLPFGKTTIKMRQKLKKTAWTSTDPLMRSGGYTFEPSVRLSIDGPYYAHTNKNGEIFKITAFECHSLERPRYDLRDAMRTVSVIGYEIDRLYPGLRKIDNSDDIDSPTIHYSAPTFTITIHAKLNADYDWEIHLEAKSKRYKDDLF